MSIISREPRFLSPITFKVAVLGLDYELAYDKILKAWLNPNTLQYAWVHSDYYIELSLPRLHLEVHDPFQGVGGAIVTRSTTGDEMMICLPISWVITVISNVPYEEVGTEQAIEWLIKNGFIIRKFEELS